MPDPLQILGFGALAIDEILYVDQPLSSGKGRVVDRLTDHGGNVATALVSAARLGARAGFIGWLNEAADEPAAVALSARGVDIRFRAAQTRRGADPFDNHRRSGRRTLHRLRRRGAAQAPSPA